MINRVDFQLISINFHLTILNPFLCKYFFLNDQLFRFKNNFGFILKRKSWSFTEKIIYIDISLEPHHNLMTRVNAALQQSMEKSWLCLREMVFIANLRWKWSFWKWKKSFGVKIVNLRQNCFKIYITFEWAVRFSV